MRVSAEAAAVAVAVTAPDAQAAADIIDRRDKMANIIVVLIVIGILMFAFRGSIKHMKGEGACCGGGAGRETIEKKKLDGSRLGEKTMTITGMHCDHCVARVTKAINKIDGASAKVNLRKGQAVVSYDREISDDDLKRAVEEQGYHVTEVR